MLRNGQMAKLEGEGHIPSVGQVGMIFAGSMAMLCINIAQAMEGQGGERGREAWGDAPNYRLFRSFVFCAIWMVNQQSQAVPMDVLMKKRTSKQLQMMGTKEVSRLLLGLNCGKVVATMPLPDSVLVMSQNSSFDLQAYRFCAEPEMMRPPRIVRVGLVQNSIVLPTTAPFQEQKMAIMQKVQSMIEAAGTAGVNIVCLQEFWTMPFGFCTREKRWCEFAESVDGESTQFLQKLAQKYNMVIVSPILERDLNHGETIWNTAVVIGNHGNIIGKHRKGILCLRPAYGMIGINICYGRHIPPNCLAFGLNGAEIVLNPSATVEGLTEPMWPIEARNSAIASSYFVGSINRVGTEVFPNPFTSGDGKPQHADLGRFYGSSYFSAPDGSCTPCLSRCQDGLIIADMDLNLCRQMEDKWGFRMTARYDMYAELLANYIKPEFEPQVVIDPLLVKEGSQ
eukprot:Gb_26371 [translate_table: standard]